MRQWGLTRSLRIFKRNAESRNRRPDLCVNSRKTAEVSEVGGSNRQDIGGSGGCGCLAGKDRIGIQVLRARSRYAGVSQECPEVASATHRSRGDRQVKKPPLKVIQPAQARGCSSTHELPPNFVIRDLGNNNVCAAGFECEEPGLALSDCWLSRRTADQPQRP